MADPRIRGTARIAESLKLDRGVVDEVVQLLDAENTVPFIARYRKEKTGGLDPMVLRRIQTLNQQQRSVQGRVESIKKKIGDKITVDITNALDSAHTIEEVDEVYAPFKKGAKGTLAERARQAGLEKPAQLVLTNPRGVQLNQWVRPGSEGCGNEEEIARGVQHILADVIAKCKDAEDHLKSLLSRHPPYLETCLSRSASKDANKDKKYEQYHSFKMAVPHLGSHQILAINRAEQNKILTVKVTIPAHIKDRFLHDSFRRWIPTYLHERDLVRRILKCAVEDAYSRLIEPKFCRNTRRSLSKRAQAEGIDIFTQNLSRLLLMPPVKGKVVLGMDPGFSNGCKVALLGDMGEVLETAVIFPFGRNSNTSHARSRVKELLLKHGCQTIAIGNGVGCRETEAFVSQMIKGKVFAPLDVVYCIVSEDGASIYSASEEAQSELPGLDISLRGAVSIGRRLQDPLAELVKIEPKHLGIGMYQHDMNDSLLHAALDGVVEDCVCFVGVDLNVAGVSVLRRIAGLNEKKAKAIVEWREKHGGFVNREQLKNIKGIGSKTYEQCVGFVRIIRTTSPRAQEVYDTSTSTKSQSKYGGEPDFCGSRSAKSCVVEDKAKLRIKGVTKTEESEACVSQASTSRVKKESADVTITWSSQAKTGVITISDSDDDDEVCPIPSKKRKAVDEAAAGAKKKMKKTKESAKLPKLDFLDMTWIHPESYHIAKKFMNTIGVGPEDIGRPVMKTSIDLALRNLDIAELARTFDVGVPTLEQIIDGLRQPTDHDVRANFEKPLFKRHVTSIQDLKRGMGLRGRVTNVTSFGAFVDCGCGRDGLIHKSKMNGCWGNVGLGDVVEVTVENVDIHKQHVALLLKRVCSQIDPQTLVATSLK